MTRNRTNRWWIAVVVGGGLVAVAMPLASITLAAVGLALVAEAVWMRTGSR